MYDRTVWIELILPMFKKSLRKWAPDPCSIPIELEHHLMRNCVCNDFSPRGKHFRLMVETQQDKISPVVHVLCETRQDARIRLTKPLAQTVKASAVLLEIIVFHSIARVVNRDPPCEVTADSPLTRTSPFERSPFKSTQCPTKHAHRPCLLSARPGALRYKPWLLKLRLAIRFLWL